MPGLASLGVSISRNFSTSAVLSPVLNINPALFTPYAFPLLAAATAIVLLYRFVVYPLFFSPLIRIPCAHPLAAVTSLWMDWRRFTGREVETTWEAFGKHGPYVRLGPNEIAVNTILGGVATAHGHGFENLDKTSWYDFFINHGLVNILHA